MNDPLRSVDPTARAVIYALVVAHLAVLFFWIASAAASPKPKTTKAE